MLSAIATVRARHYPVDVGDGVYRLVALSGPQSRVPVLQEGVDVVRC